MEVDWNTNYFLIEENKELEEYLLKNNKIDLKSYGGDNNLYFISENKCYKCIRKVYSNSFCILDDKKFEGFTHDKIKFKEVLPSYNTILDKINKVTKENVLNHKYLNIFEILETTLISKNQLISYINSIGGIIEQDGKILFMKLKDYFNDVLNFSIYLRLNQFDQTCINLLELKPDDTFDMNIILLNSKIIFHELKDGYFKLNIKIIIECLILKILEKADQLFYLDLVNYILNELDKIIQYILIDEVVDLNYIIFKQISKYGIRFIKQNNKLTNTKDILFMHITTTFNNPKDKIKFISKYKIKYTKEEIEFYYKNLFGTEDEFEKFFKKFFKKSYENKNILNFYKAFIELKENENIEEEWFYNVKKIW